MPPLHDVTLAVHQYFTLPPDEEVRRSDLQDLLNGALGELADALGRARPEVRLRDVPADESIRLADVARAPFGADEVAGDVTTLHDGLFLRIVTLRRGPQESDRLPVLTTPDLERLTYKAPNSIGSLTAWTAEVDSLADAPSAAEALARHAFPGRSTAAVSTDVGALHLTDDGERLGAVIVRLRGDAPSDATFLDTLPELAMCALKAVHVRQILESQLAESAVADRVLRSQLRNRPGGSSATLTQLKQFNDALTTSRAELADVLGRIDAELNTLAINRENLQAALRSSSLAAHQEELAGLLFERRARTIERQARADVAYRESTLRRAEMFAQAFEATADYHEAIETRRLGWIALALACLQAAALVPDLYGDAFDRFGILGRLARVGGATVGLFFAGWLLLKFRHPR